MKTGDLLLCSGSLNPLKNRWWWLDAFIQFFTLSPVNHIGMVLALTPEEEKSLLGLESRRLETSTKRLDERGDDHNNYIDHIDHSDSDEFGLRETDTYAVRSDVESGVGSGVETRYYVWESGYEGFPDVENKSLVYGVQITPLDKFLENNGEVYYQELLSRGFSSRNHISFEDILEVHRKVHHLPYDFHLSHWVEALFQLDPYPQKKEEFWCSAFVGYLYFSLGILDETVDWSILRPSDFYNYNIRLNERYAIKAPCMYEK